MNKSERLKKSLIADLELSVIESEIFLALMHADKTTSNEFNLHFNNNKNTIIENSRNLVQKGMLIELNKDEFCALHPKFAIVNRYKRLCEEKNIVFKKNLKIDNLGTQIEKYKEDKK
jgi:hypothetical protein